MVDTVRGQVPADQLGTVLMHEHVFVLNEEIRRNYPEFWDEEERVADAVRRLRELAERGVDTIVDPTVIGLGRDVERVARVNAEVDLNIIAATGLYTYDSVPFFFRLHGPGTLLGGDELMVDMFVKDITEGIAGTGIKAAFLKCAIEEELTPGVERVLNAVAEAHNRTGVPITVHTSPGHRTGLVAQEVLRRNGVDLGAVVIGHSGDTTDTDYLRELVDNGSYIGMDRFGLDALLATDERVVTIAALAGQGLADRMVLAHDASCHNDWFPQGTVEQVLPDWHFTHIHDAVLPALREAGVTEQQITTMLVDNPRRYFS
ncbi:phosphotriesterase-related protein [Saccharopolyspora rhizosphaerae]|uniref:Phosphotriesterase-related protein n=1 Tax=Saccharopolyspora rhizosphaerae TaxID=2492662 RepID=A0A426K4P0_9PSEU|nr:phosphotriesterase-related protein [Saccharopolyspora rhizosphaerae]RRO20341.1 phosphotriesterase-related protein [Saccharopolyspora rhizosphaerae]